MSKKETKKVDEAAAVDPQVETKWVAVATEDGRILAEATNSQLLENIFKNLIPQGRVVIKEQTTDDGQQTSEGEE